jgi:hypothetical protein
MSGYRRNYPKRASGAGSRWMNLRYAGVCKVCGDAIAKGALAYWDQGARTVTCEAIDCARADGLTERAQRWAGNPDGVETLRAFRVGAAAPANRVTVTRFNSGAVVYQNARGRCEDAPCCGCCS